jgi:hypothetical protein
MKCVTGPENFGKFRQSLRIFSTASAVTLAKAGVHTEPRMIRVAALWIPAFAGMTYSKLAAGAS